MSEFAMEMGPGSGHSLAVCPSPLSCGLHLQGIKDELEYQVAGRTTGPGSRNWQWGFWPYSRTTSLGKGGYSPPSTPATEVSKCPSELHLPGLLVHHTERMGGDHYKEEDNITLGRGPDNRSSWPHHSLAPRAENSLLQSSSKPPPQERAKVQRIRRQEEQSPREKPDPAGTPGRTEPRLFTSVPR